MKISLFSSLLFVSFLFNSQNAIAREILSCAVHLHTQHSGNSPHTLKDLAREAVRSGIDVIIPTDHGTNSVEYGIYPLENILSIRRSRPSILEDGPEKYMAEVKEAEIEYPGLIILPGTEVTANYFWTGNPLRKDLTLNDWHKHILLIGFETAESFRKLPIIGNRSAGSFNPLLLSPLLLVILAFMLNTGLSIKLFLIAAGLLFTANNYPFNSIANSRFGKAAGEKPFQELIEYADNSGLLAFWAHPDAPNWEKPVAHAGAALKTSNYAESLVNTRGYTGFSIYSEGYRKTGKPGSLWDKVLMQYCAGKRDKAAWAIGELDYGAVSFKMHEILNYLWADDRSGPAVLKALRGGNLYAVWRNDKWGLKLDDFYLTAPGHGRFVSGEKLTLKSNARVRAVLNISATDNAARKIRISVIRDGILSKMIETDLPAAVIYEDLEPLAPGMHYYRFIAEESYPHAICINPIFVEKL